MGQRTYHLEPNPEPVDPLVAVDAEIQQTREDMSETLEAIQEKLSPAQVTDDAKDAAIETVDHVVEEAKAAIQELTESASAATMEAVDNALIKVRELLPELHQQAQETARGASELASVAAMEAVEHALLKVREAMPDLTQQAQDAAREAVDHAISEAKSALLELGAQTRFAVRDATIGKVERMAQTTNETTKRTGATVMQTIKQNPGPAALTALGVTWLVINGRSGGTQSQGGNTVQSSSETEGAEFGSQVQAGVNQARDVAGDVADHAKDGIGTAADGVTKGAEAVIDGVTQGAETVVGGVTQGAGTVVNGVTHAVTTAASGVQGTVTSAGSQVKQVPGHLRHMVEEHPMRLGLVGIAVGSAAAMAIPETRRENQLLGEARDTVVERAQSTAQSTLQKVQTVAEEVGNTVEKEAKYAGLTQDESSS